MVRVCLIVVGVLVLSLSRVAGADTLYFSFAGDDDWSNTNNWFLDSLFLEEAGRVPDSSDEVRLSGSINFCTIDDYEADCAFIQTSGTSAVVLTNAATLTIAGEENEQTVLRVSISSDSELIFDDDQTVNFLVLLGTGIVRLSDGAHVCFGVVCVGGDITCRGPSTEPLSDPVFDLIGVVDVQDGGTLQLGPVLTVLDYDAAGYIWRLGAKEGDVAELRFEVGATLEGGFRIADSGTDNPGAEANLVINETVATTGDLDGPPGQIIVANGECFTWSGGDVGNGCSGPMLSSLPTEFRVPYRIATFRVRAPSRLDSP